MQLEKFPKNVIRYAVILFLVGYFRRVLKISFYEVSTKWGPELTPFQSHVVKITSFVFPFLLVYMSGILADKYGRRLVWAVSLFLYGGCMVGLGVLAPVPSHPLATFASFESLLAATVLYSFPSAFAISSVAWLFDHEGKKGLKNAHGILHILSALPILAGMIITLESSLNTGTNLMLTGVIALAAGGLVVTFPENYGSQSSWKEINKTVVNQFISKKVLQLIVAYSIFMGFPLAVFGSAMIHFMLMTSDFKPELFTLYYIIFIAVSLCAGILIVLMKRINYRKLIVYPMIIVILFYFLLPFPPTILWYFILDGGYLFVSYLIQIGIVLLVNDSITENRATALAVMTLLMAIPTLLTFFWNMVLTTIEWEMACVIAGALALISLVYLNQAVEIHEEQYKSIKETE